MKIKSISALLAALGCSVSLGATTTITDFSGLLGGTSQDGISLIGINATATGTGGLSLNNGSLDFTMTGATNRPNISANQSFSVALTFDLSTLNAATDSTLFSAQFGTGAYAGLFGAQYKDGGVHFGYWGTSQTNGKYGTTDPTVSVTGNTGNLSVVWTKTSDNNVNLDVYLDSSKIGSITSNGGGINFSKQLEHLFVGGKGTTDSGSITNSFTTSSDLTLEGMQIVTGGVMDENAFKSYYNQLVPEPATASLSLLGLSVLMLRRRRS